MFRPQDNMGSGTIPSHFYGLTQKFVDGLKQSLAAGGIFAS
jgi:hypothetical protein